MEDHIKLNPHGTFGSQPQAKLSHIIIYVLAWFTGKNNIKNRRLEIQAHNYTFTQVMKFKSYMAKHRFLRLQMLQIESLNIQYELRSVRILINRETFHPRFIYISHFFRFSGIPTSLQDLILIWWRKID